MVASSIALPFTAYRRRTTIKPSCARGIRGSSHSFLLFSPVSPFLRHPTVRFAGQETDKLRTFPKNICILCRKHYIIFFDHSRNPTESFGEQKLFHPQVRKMNLTTVQRTAFAPEFPGTRVLSSFFGPTASQLSPQSCLSSPMGLKTSDVSSKAAGTLGGAPALSASAGLAMLMPENKASTITAGRLFPCGDESLFSPPARKPFGFSSFIQILRSGTAVLRHGGEDCNFDFSADEGSMRPRSSCIFYKQPRVLA